MVKTILAIHQNDLLAVILNVFHAYIYLIKLIECYRWIKCWALLFLCLVENENHCDFVKLRDMLLCTNTEHLKEVTHAKHYECYRHCRLQKMGFTDVGPDNQQLRWVQNFLEQANGWFTKPLLSWDAIILEWEELYFSYRQLFWMFCVCF